MTEVYTNKGPHPFLIVDNSENEMTFKDQPLLTQNILSKEFKIVLEGPNPSSKERHIDFLPTCLYIHSRAKVCLLLGNVSR